MSPPSKKYLRRLKPHLHAEEQVSFVCMAFGAAVSGAVTRAALDSGPAFSGMAAEVPTSSRMIIGFADSRIVILGDGLFSHGKVTEIPMDDVTSIEAGAAKIRTGTLTLRFHDGTSAELRLPPEDSRAAAKQFS